MATKKKVSFTDLKAIVAAKPSASMQAFLIEDHWFLSYTDGAYTLFTTLSTTDPTQAADVTDFVTNFLPSANGQIDTKQLRGASDGTFIGNVSDALKVTQSAVSGSGISVVPAEKLVHIPEYLENAGSREMDVDGDPTPVVFDFTPGAGEIWLLNKLAIVILDPGSMDKNDFGAIPGPLTNGVLLEIKANGITHTVFNFTDNLDVSHYFIGAGGGGGDDSDTGWLDTLDQFRGCKTYGPPITLDGDQGDFIRVTVRDDIRALKTLCMLIHKWKVIG